MKRIILASVLLVLVVVICGGLVWFNFFRQTMINQFFAGMKAPTVTVSTIEVKTSTWKPGLDAVGTVTAAKGVDVAVEVGGIVKSVGFKANDRVKAGQVLLQIDDTLDRAGLGGARSTVTVSTDALQRSQTLVQRSITTVADLQTAQNKLDQAVSALNQIEATIDRKAVKAPFEGTIGIPKLDIGQYVQPAAVVATLQNLDVMKVDFTLPEQVLPSLSIGQPASFGLTSGDLRFTGKLTGIDPKIDPTSRLVSVQAEVANSEGTLRPGQFVHVRIHQPQEANVIAVPQTAVTISLYGSFVYTVEPAPPPPAGTPSPTSGAQAATAQPAAPALVAKQVFVKAGRRSGSEIEITEGLSPGAKVVTAGQNRLSNGSPIAVDNSVEPTAASAAAKTKG